MIQNLDPVCVWKNFYALTQIPRPSGHEEKVSEFVYDFGKKLGLEAYRDEVGNVLIRKPATPGMENRKGVILQGHIDMVPQNNKEVKHDWLKDPVKPRIEGDWVWATGTTLGADNGMGVAAAMAVLESKTLKHGPIEAFFTIDEERGMTGANALKKGVLKGQILLNLDSETEGELYVGCAGGVEVAGVIPFETEKMPERHSTWKLTVTGLRGGHSGMDIHEGRANANKLTARLTLPLLKEQGCRLSNICGGSLRNAIPFDGEALLAVPDGKEKTAAELVSRAAEEIKAEYNRIDPGIKVFFEKVSPAASVIAGEKALDIVRAILACPCGVDRMSLEIPGLVESSNNLAIVRRRDENHISIESFARASSESIKSSLVMNMTSALELAGAEVSVFGDYSGWVPNSDSAILKSMKNLYSKLFGREPEVKAIHAGLECGIISGACPGLDMISFGPTILSPHSPAERCNIASVGAFWKLLTATLENVPENK